MRNLFILFAAIASLSTFSCKENKAPATSASSDYQKLFDRSMAMKDYPTAITAIQLILLSDSNSTLRDSLPELYGAVNNVAACLQTVDETLKRYPKEEKFLNLKLLCLQELGRMDEQFAMLRNLYETTNKPQYIAQIASIQVATGNINDARETIDTILVKYKDSKDSLDVFVDETNKQKVPVTAAAWNMKGYIYMQQKNIEKAKECYFKAMEIYPNFIMPRRNLEMIFARKY